MKCFYFGHRSPAAESSALSLKQNFHLVACAETELAMKQFASEDVAAKENVSV